MAIFYEIVIIFLARNTTSDNSLDVTYKKINKAMWYRSPCRHVLPALLTSFKTVFSMGNVTHIFKKPSTGNNPQLIAITDNTNQAEINPYIANPTK